VTPVLDALPDGRRPGAARLRVATVPHTDPYVEAVLPPDAVHVGPVEVPSRWLDPAFLAGRASEIDVLHLHTGYAHLLPAALENWTEELRRLGIPLVVTVHQLRDPAQESRARHDAHLAAVLSTAEIVLTLTPGAADEIAERFGRTAIVVAHPSVAAPLPGLGAERGLVGVAVGPPSPAVPDPEAGVRAALSGAVSGGGRLRVFVDPGLRVAAELPFLAALAADGAVEVVAARRPVRPGRPGCSSCTPWCSRRAVAPTRATSRSAGTWARGSSRRAAACSPTSGRTW
jgi:hypothetical protein